MEQRDLLPFGNLLRAGVPSVMVGHLNVPGLTERGVPATLSPSAYRYLRERAGASRLLMTDSLSMGAISVGMRLTRLRPRCGRCPPARTWCWSIPGSGPGPVVDAVAAALGRGSYARSSAVASARRMLAVKLTTNAPLSLSSLSPAQGTTEASLTPTLFGVARDRVGGTLTAQFFVRSAGSASWNVANGARVTVTSGSRASYRLGAGRLQPGRTYEWSVRPCNPVSVCAPPGPVLRFTTG